MGCPLESIPPQVTQTKGTLGDRSLLVLVLVLVLVWVLVLVLVLVWVLVLVLVLLFLDACPQACLATNGVSPHAH